MRLVSFLDMDLTNEGIEDVVVNGSYPTSLFLITVTNLGQEGISRQLNADYLTIQYDEGIEWGATIFLVDSLGVGSARPSRNFSNFEAIELELRGNQSEQEVFFSLKDRLDPDDGMETRVPVILQSNWTTYRFDRAITGRYPPGCPCCS